MVLTKKAERTKAKLLDSAKILIQESGFDKVSVEEITRHAGVAKGTFYHYFQCKEDVVREFSTERLEAIYSDTLDMDGSTSEKLVFYFTSLMKMADSMGVNLIRQWMHDVMDPHLDEDGTEQIRDSYKRIHSVLRRGIADHTLKEDTPTDFLTKLLLSHLYGALTTWCIMGGRFSIGDEADKFVSATVFNTIEKYEI